ncbi:MAG: SusC/RagA family TonB-linked outer membrane protein [Tannerellaceae bacterium]|jgi:TonB-linked SusC/RagA family outer membrane protein|nr:SusC/RagA family TonB-linked outer membrane protein [Tannerellaceae bacterium]
MKRSHKLKLSDLKKIPVKKICFLILLLCVTSPFINAQALKTITGSVNDKAGEAIIGANIIEKGNTTNGTTSDVEGKFSLRVASNATIIISYLGYDTQEIATGNKLNFTITLIDDHLQLNEVVVIGYGSVSKKELTSAVSHVSNKDFLNISNRNPLMQIQGKVAGLTIDNNAAADPNSNPSVQLRGVTSRSASNDPLIVVDGIPGANLSNVNENDIESIDVLKDGAASAIYGTRGSNGVIIITTKKGNTGGAAKVTYNGYVSFDTPKKDLNVLNAKDFVAHNRGQNYGGDTDWFDELTQVGVTHSHTLQLSGGTAKNNYRATVDYRNGEGIDIRSNRKEIGARLSLQHESPNGLYSVILNAAPRKIDRNNSDQEAFNRALTLNPTYPVMDPDDTSRFYHVFGFDENNPVEDLKLDKSGAMEQFLDWDGTFKLNLLPLFGSNENHSLNTQITLAQQVNNTNSFYFRPSTHTLQIRDGRRGDANQTRSNNIQESLEWLGNYMFAKNHHTLKAMTGYSYQYFQNSRLYAENKDFASDVLTYNNLGNGNYNREIAGRLGMSSSKEDSKLIAFFGRLSYDYKNKYLATASFRYEGSSRFGVNNKWGYFPAVSVGWRISEEDFMKEINWLDELKIRADYGETGNQNFGNYRSLKTMVGVEQFYLNGRFIQGWAPGININQDLRWEKGQNWNVGVDFGLFGNRVSGSFNYFHRTQKDLLGDYQVPSPPNLAQNLFVNVGTMKNEGIEIDLNIDVVRTKDFSYSIGLIGYTTNNKFESFSNDVYHGQTYYWLSGFPGPGLSAAAQRIEEGKRIGTFYIYEYAGVDDQGNWVIKDNEGNVKPFTEATEEDKKVMGNGLPKFNLSWNNTLTYKNWSLSIFLRGNFGYQVYDTHSMYFGLQSAAPNTNVMYSAYEENAHITGTNQHLSYFLHDMNYLKLDVATLGYTFKVDNKWVESIRLYGTGRNLVNFTSYKGVDPNNFSINGLEPGLVSGKKNYYPSSRQYLMGLQVIF